MVEQLEPLTMLTGVSVVADAPSYIEGQTAWFTFTLEEPAPQAFQLDILVSGGPAGPTGYVMPISQGQTSAHVDFPTTDNSTPGDSYTLSLEITGSSESGPSGPFDSASTQILDNDGESGPMGPSGPGDPSGPSAPIVTIEATDPNAHEVGPDAGVFTITRSSAETTNSLTVQFTVSGYASMGQDYANFPSSITIPADASSVTLTVNPIMDTDSSEGVEDVKVTITASASYTLGEYVQATVNIRDRAGVKQILATAGVTGLPPEGPGRNVTGGSLELTQDDTVTFKAVPTDGGDFAPNEPTWMVTGEGTTTGETRTVTFGTYRIPGETKLQVGTPANGTPNAWPKVTFTIVPYPTGIAGTRIADQPPLIELPDRYGTVYVHTLIPSSGATGDDLFDFEHNKGKLEVWEHVEWSPNPPYGPPVFEVVDEKMFISESGDGDALIYDEVFTGVANVFPYNGFFPSGPPLSSPQDILWKSNAADSLDFQNEGWHEFVTDLPINVSLAMSSDGWTVTTTDNAVPFTQPHCAPGSWAHLETGDVIPWGSHITVTMTGTVQLSADDVAAGSKTFEVILYDDDFPDANDLLSSVTVTVPAANGKAGMYTPWWKTTILMNIPEQDIFGQWYGEVGGSDEVTAEVFFWAPGAYFTYSNIASVTAAPMP